MAAITIAGTALDCVDGSGEGKSIKIGTKSRAFAGNLRNGERAQKRTFNFITIPTLEATWDTLRAAVALGVTVTVSGTVLSGDSISASVEVEAKPAASLPGYFIITGSGEEV